MIKQLGLALALTGTCALSTLSSPAFALETFEARMAATDASIQARADMLEAFGPKELKPGQYVWRDVRGDGEERVVISLGDQMVYLYRGDTLVAAATISSGKPGKDTPAGIFSILAKKELAHSNKYDNAPMPYMQRIDDYGIALHAGFNPGKPASHGCVRLPKDFAKKLYSVTDLGTPVLIGA